MFALLNTWPEETERKLAPRPVEVTCVNCGKVFTTHSIPVHDEEPTVWLTFKVCSKACSLERAFGKAPESDPA